MTITFHPIRYQGVAFAVHADGRTVGTIRNEARIHGGWIAFRPRATQALLDPADGFAAAFASKDDAAQALVAARVAS